jgi:hypothetical protein
MTSLNGAPHRAPGRVELVEPRSTRPLLAHLLKGQARAHLRGDRLFARVYGLLVEHRIKEAQEDA